MSYHTWGDDDVDWRGISDAAIYIGTFCSRWGRISVTDMKEKYGTARVYCGFGWWSLYAAFRPGYHWVGEEWYWRALSKVRMDWIHPVLVPYQKFIYRLAYKRAVAKWPHLVAEIVDGADWDELLKGIK